MNEAVERLLDGAGATVTIPVVAEVFGISRAHAYALANRDALGVRVLRLGHRFVVPTSEVRRALGAGFDNHQQDAPTPV